ncbi:MAG: hypothetical protein KGH58_04630 [Candidatus Micrarchaeota archaeon]|nr:hypothetical protein [Candidatus Micrarchaeota archaeon]
MKDEKDGFLERKMQIWKRKEEMLNSMGDKELRAFIKGYMMGQKAVFKNLDSASSCGCQCGSSCGCGEKECNCGKE